MVTEIHMFTIRFPDYFLGVRLFLIVGFQNKCVSKDICRILLDNHDFVGFDLKEITRECACLLTPPVCPNGVAFFHQDARERMSCNLFNRTCF